MTHLPATVVGEALHTPAAFLVQQRHDLDGVSTRILQHCAQACQGVPTVNDVLHLYIQQRELQTANELEIDTSATTGLQDLDVIVGASKVHVVMVPALTNVPAFGTWESHTAAADAEFGEHDTGLPWPCVPCKLAPVVQSCMEAVLSRCVAQEAHQQDVVVGPLGQVTDLLDSHCTIGHAGCTVAGGLHEVHPDVRHLLADLPDKVWQRSTCMTVACCCYAYTCV